MFVYFMIDVINDFSLIHILFIGVIHGYKFESFGLIMVVVKVVKLKNTILARVKNMSLLFLTYMFVVRKVCE